MILSIYSNEVHAAFKEVILIFFEGVASNVKFKTRCPRMLKISKDFIGSLVAVIVIFSFAGFGAISKSISVTSAAPRGYIFLLGSLTKKNPLSISLITMLPLAKNG